MPLVIESLTTTLEVRDEVQIRRLVRDEVQRCLRERERSQSGRVERGADPRDPSAGSSSGMR